MVNNQNGLDAMSAYERKAWEHSLKRIEKAPRRIPVPEKFSEFIDNSKQKALSFADEKLPTEKIQMVVKKVMEGTLELTFTPALRSVNADKALVEYQKRYPKLESLEDLKTLDLEKLDQFRNRKGLFVGASAAQGAISSLVITGTELATSVSAGVAAGTVVAAVTGDIVASLAMMGRTVGSVAIRYGYDVSLPDEEPFVMGIMSLGIAGSLEAKRAALGQFSKLSQLMMRNPSWTQLNEKVLVRLIARMYESLGLRLTKRKLAEVVPFVGVGVNAALNAAITRDVYRRAEDAYRLRFLSEKYGVNPWAKFEDDEGSDDSSAILFELEEFKGSEVIETGFVGENQAKPMD
jgi:hypothetical protein